MPNRILNIDAQMVMLNAGSAGALTFAWAIEQLTSWLGIATMASVILLNLSKMYLNYKNAKNLK